MVLCRVSNPAAHTHVQIADLNMGVSPKTRSLFLTGSAGDMYSVSVSLQALMDCEG